ncbi:TolC family protein [Spirochaeta dissipatitropha]
MFLNHRAPGLAGFVLLSAILFSSPLQAQTGTELSLDTALREAEEYSFALQRSAAALREADAGLLSARARQLPKIDANISASYLSNPPDGVRIPRGSLGSQTQPGSTYPVPVPDQDVVLLPDPENTFYRFQATLQQPLFTWGKLGLGIDAAAVQREIALVDSQAALRELRRDVIQAYYGLRFAGIAAEKLAEIEERAEQMLRDQELAFEVGTVNRQTLLETRVELYEVRVQRINAEQARKSAADGLSLLIGRTLLSDEDPDRTELTDDYRFESGPDNLLEQAASETAALAASSDLAGLELQGRLARIGAEIERRSGMWRPDIALQLQWESSGQRLPPQANWHDSWDNGLTLTIAGSFGIYDGGAKSASLQAARAVEQQVSAGIAQLEEAKAFQLRQYREAVLRARGQRDLAAARRELAVERARNAAVSFENDLITRTEARGAEILQLMAELEEERTRFELESALVDLAYISGLLGDFERRP